VSIPIVHIPSQFPRRSCGSITSIITAPALPSCRENHTPRRAILRRPLHPRRLDLECQLHLRHPRVWIIQWRLQVLNIVIKDRRIVDVRDRDRMLYAVRYCYRLAAIHDGVVELGDDVDVLSVRGRAIVDCDVPVYIPEEARDADAAGRGASSLMDAEVC
jgi:hypothetical protein